MNRPVPLYRRRRVLLASAHVATAAFSLASQRTALALMAGSLPDSPSKRIDPNTSNSIWAGVGAVRRGGGGVYSGCLVHPRYALTAAHVVSGARTGDLVFQLNNGDKPTRLGVKRVLTHPRYRGQTKPFAFFDVALLELESEVSAAVPNYQLYTGSLLPGTVLTFVGYGASGFGESGPRVPASASIKRIGQNHLNYFVAVPTPDKTTKQKGIFLYDFDGVNAQTNAMGGLTLGNATETSAATGDSGAPVFVERGSYRALVGILTFVANFNKSSARLSGFGASGGGILISSVAPWVTSTIR